MVFINNLLSSYCLLDNNKPDVTTLALGEEGGGNDDCYYNPPGSYDPPGPLLPGYRDPYEYLSCGYPGRYDYGYGTPYSYQYHYQYQYQYPGHYGYYFGPHHPYPHHRAPIYGPFNQFNQQNNFINIFQNWHHWDNPFSGHHSFG